MWFGHPSHPGSSAPVRSSEKRKYGTAHFTSGARRASKKLCEDCGEKNGMIPRPEWMWNKGYLGGLLREGSLDTLPSLISASLLDLSVMML